MLEIMEKYQWDYYTYLSQPIWLIELIIKKMTIDSQKAKARENKK